MPEQQLTEANGASKPLRPRPARAFSVADVRERTTLGHAKVLGLLEDGTIPGVRVGAGVSWRWRVDPTELEAIIAAQLPADPIPPIEAVAIQAGRRVKQGSAAYARHLARLKRAVRAGRITQYRIFGVTRYSRSEVVEEKERLASGGVNGTATRNRYAATRKRLAASGLIGLADAATLCGVHWYTAYTWATGALYGAVKVDGVWFLDRELLATRDRAPYRRAQVVVRCSACNKPVESKRTPSQLDHHRPYCHACYEAHVEQWLRAGPQAIRDMNPDGRFEIWRKGQQKRTDDRSAQRAACSDSMTKRWSSSKTALPLAEASAEARGVTHHPERVKSRVLSRTHKGKAGRKRDEGQRAILLGILGEVLPGLDAAAVSESELLASVGLVAWQRGVGTLRADIPASKPERMDEYEQVRAGPDDEAFDPKWRPTVVARIRRHIGVDAKALQIART
jgi:endogenous inhibitor of DNA gyrase (YacG/DUF329 family)